MISDTNILIVHAAERIYGYLQKIFSRNQNQIPNSIQTNISFNDLFFQITVRYMLFAQENERENRERENRERERELFDIDFERHGWRGCLCLCGEGGGFLNGFPNDFSRIIRFRLDEFGCGIRGLSY